MATIRRRVWVTASGEQREAWQVFFIDQQGKRRHRQFDRRKAADAFMVEARAQVAAGTYTPDSTSITVAEAAEIWLARCEAEGLERATVSGYRSYIVHHTAPLIGAERLSRLTVPRVEAFRDELVSRVSRHLASKVLTVFKGIIGEAMRRGLCAQNVARDVRVRSAGRHRAKVEIPSKAEVRDLLAASAGERRAILTVLVFCGLRASELRGLKWRDADLEHRLLRVRQRADTYGKIGPLKSASARRDIPMGPMVVHALKEWRLASTSDDLVFPGRGGRPMSHYRMIALIGPAHRFRHFCASWLIDQGFGPKRVQALLGHSSIAITLDTYTHLWPQEDDHEKFAAGELALVGFNTNST